jgi:multicomponent Na+:H+ antiporter subunit A
LALAGGLAPGLAGAVARGVAEALAGGGPAPGVGYHLDLRAGNLLALAAFAAGLGLVLLRRTWQAPAAGLLRGLGRVGPARGYEAGLGALNRLSHRLLAFEVRDLRSRIAAVLLPSALLVAAAIGVSGAWRHVRAGPLETSDLPLALALLLAAGAAIGVTRPRRHLAITLAASAVGFVLAGVYALYGAPDVALVATLVETLLSILFLAVLALFPRRVLEQQSGRGPRHLWRDRFLALAAGGLAFAVCLVTLSTGPAPSGAAAAHLALGPAAHGQDVVTVILADFRGLDTLGEVTVVAITMIGILALLARGARPDA